MLPVGRGLLIVVVLACLVSFPARADADIITMNSIAVDADGSFRGEFDLERDDDVRFLYFSLTGAAFLTVEFTSHLAPEGERGFDPTLSLFADVPGSFDPFGLAGPDLEDTYWYHREFFPADLPPPNGIDIFIDGLLLAAGNYALAVTQFGNSYTPGLGFTYQGISDFTSSELWGPGNGTAGPCETFVGWMGDCRTREFAGRLAIVPEDVPQPVPEPGSLTLLALGSAALLARRGRQSRREIKNASRT
jgi:hypothetical protein